MKRSSTSTDETPLKRVLAISNRPLSMETLVGQDKTIATLKSQIESNRIPHFFLITGSIGSGKTTLARILALSLQVTDLSVDKPQLKPLARNDWDLYNKYDIDEINASDNNGIDFIRHLITKNKYKPFGISKAKVIILDESHMLTPAAQQCLLKETEDTNDSLYYIFVTSNDSKIIPALKRRAYIITPNLLDAAGIKKLIDQTCTNIHEKIDTGKFIEKIQEENIRSPGLILQAMERYISGFTIDEAIFMNNSSITKLDTFGIAQQVAKGNL